VTRSPLGARPAAVPLVVAAGIAIMAISLFPSPAFAWTPGTHVFLGEAVLRSLAMLPADVGQLVIYSRTGEIPKDARDAIGKAITFKQAIIDTQRQIEERNKQVNDIAQEQVRIRENMKTVDQKTKYYEDLLTKLSKQESQIEKLQGERDDLLKKRDGQQKELEDYLTNLNVG